MAELADAPDSKSGSRKRVGVRPSLWAPEYLNIINLKHKKAELVVVICGSHQKMVTNESLSTWAFLSPNIKYPLDSVALLA